MAIRKDELTRTFPKKKFVLANMRGTIATCADAIYKDVKKQNPEADPDEIENDVRDLALKHGGGEVESPDLETGATLIRPEYSLSADMLNIAFEAFKDKKYNECFSMVAAMFECEDAPQLVEALQIMNTESAIGVQAEATTDGDDDKEDEDDNDDHLDDDPGDMDAAMEEQIAALEDSDGDQAVIEPPEDEDDSEASDEVPDPDEEDDSTPADDEPFGRDPVMSSAVDNSFTEDEDDEDGARDPEYPSNSLDDKEGFEDEDSEDGGNGDDSDPAVPMGGTSSHRASKTSTASVKQRQLRAIANKLSLDGGKDKLRQAAEIVRMGSAR